MYNRSQLVLYSQAAAQVTSGTWSYILPGQPNADGQTLSVSVYGVDAAGNRTSPVGISYRIDVTPPTLMVNPVAAEVPLSEASQALLSGQVMDGSGQFEVYLKVIGANGVPHRGMAALAGNDWTYVPPLGEPGVYTVWVQARDAAGNETILGPYSITVTD